MDSNHRSLATADLQSAPFSHSGTYPYYIKFSKMPLTGFEPVASPLPRECATPAPQRLKYLFVSRECCYPPSTRQHSVVSRSLAKKAQILVCTKGVLLPSLHSTTLSCLAEPCHKGSNTCLYQGSAATLPPLDNTQLSRGALPKRLKYFLQA